MTPEQLSQFNEMYEWFKNMQRSSTIPLSTDQAFRERFLKNIGGFSDGGDGGTVNVDTYNSFDVLVPSVTGKRTIKIDGVNYDFLYQ